MQSRIRSFNEVFFSLYCATIVGWILFVAYAGQTRYFYLWHPNAVSLSRFDISAQYVEVFAVPAILVFILLRLGSEHRLSHYVLRVGGGILVVFGFPILCIYGSYYPYRRNIPVTILVMELCATTVYAAFCLWFRHKLSLWLFAALIVSHHLLWWMLTAHFFSSQWSQSDYVRCATATLGITYSLLWAAGPGKAGVGLPGDVH